MSEPNILMAAPLRRTPLAFRCWWGGCLLAVVAGFAALEIWAPGPDVSAIVQQPGAIVLFALILLADVYPTLPWMRITDPLDDYILSTPLAIAALLVFGPKAAVVFVASGLAMALASKMVWWRVLLNTALWGLQGAAAAGVLALITGSYDWEVPMPSAVMLPISVVLAVVIESLNVVLVGTAVCLAGASSWREYLVDWRSQIAIAALALTAPIPAVLAQYQPAVLPLLALAMVAALSGMGAVSTRTALAGTDPLTSLANREILQARLKERLGQLRRTGHAVTLMLIDLDRFKQINDVYGHLAGDRVLVEVARRLEESTRSDDLVARFGGDEFAILLVGGVLPRDVGYVAGRIRSAIGRPIQVQERTVRVGVSIGSTVASERGIDPITVFQRADEALYAVKSSRPAAPTGLLAAGPGHPAEESRADLLDGDDPGDVGGEAGDGQGTPMGWDPPAWSRTQADIAWRAAVRGPAKILRTTPDR